MTETVKITVYTDGSSTANKDRKNYGGIGIFFQDYSRFNLSKSYYGDNVTNQSMELKACIKSIKRSIEIMKPTGRLWELHIYTDSMYTINCINKWAPKWILWGWKRKVGKSFKDISNLELIKELYQLSKTYPVIYHHRRAHQREPLLKDSDDWKNWYGNKQADLLAKTAMNVNKV